MYKVGRPRQDFLPGTFHGENMKMKRVEIKLPALREFLPLQELH